MYTSIMKRSLFALAIIIVCTACHSTRSFVDGASKPAGDFTFFVLGDWGVKGKANQVPVAKEMIRQSKLNNLSFITTVGDNFYDNGVTSLDDEHWKLSYEDVYQEPTKKYPWYVTLGNHDYRGNVEAPHPLRM